MKTYRGECVVDGKLLEAEETQIKIEELQDEEYNVKRSALLAKNDAETAQFM